MHNEVVAIFKPTNEKILNGEIKESARKPMMDEAKDFPVVTMMFPSPVTNGMAILHHMTKVGGTILDKDESYISLVWAEPTVIPLV